MVQTFRHSIGRPSICEKDCGWYSRLGGKLAPTSGQGQDYRRKVQAHQHCAVQKEIWDWQWDCLRGLVDKFAGNQARSGENLWLNFRHRGISAESGHHFPMRGWSPTGVWTSYKLTHEWYGGDTFQPGSSSYSVNWCVKATWFVLCYGPLCRWKIQTGDLWVQSFDSDPTDLGNHWTRVFGSSFRCY